MSTEPRCPACGALVAPDAEWCGQCFRSLRPEPAPPPSGPPVVTRSRGGRAPREGAGPCWRCPACEHENPLALDVCEVCGTPFARLFAEPAPGPRIEPARAVAWSLLWPGLGHWRAGRRADGFARMVLFAWTLGTVVVLLASGSGLGRAKPILALYALAAAATYGLSALDARRAAAGEEPVVGSRALLWASVALVVLSVVLATLLTLPVARGG